MPRKIKCSTQFNLKVEKLDIFHVTFCQSTRGCYPYVFNICRAQFTPIYIEQASLTATCHWKKNCSNIIAEISCYIFINCWFKPIKKIIICATLS